MLDILYASAMGSIQYDVQCTRPDVTYALSVTNRYQACTEEAHWNAIKTILNFQSDNDDAESQSSFVLKLNGGMVACWKSSKQATTVDSTTEAEYIATSEAAKEAVWMKNYIQELGGLLSIAEPVVIFCDSNGEIVQAKESRFHHRSKHILACYHLLREMVKWEIVRIGFFSASSVVAVGGFVSCSRYLLMEAELARLGQSLVLMEEEDLGFKNGSSNLTEPSQVAFIENDRFLLKFFHFIDHDRVATSSSWAFEKNLIVLAKISKNDNPAKVDFMWCDFHVCIHGLTLGKMTSEIASFIGGKIGRLKDFNQCRGPESWGSLMCLRVTINVSKPLPYALKI
ncbi:hypothetical protein Sango_0365300 [Sesamum angolense]|uniref:Uncharacterized protein n=1 Tax=Sesamum angolense TaxID=2727404 RepID=A0AAE1X9R9_9LAMI|nr:hypothetical protein Sango_0365300 [Sesamum angolense]